MRDWRDEERDRRMDEMYARRHDSNGGDDGTDLVGFFVGVIIVIALILAGLGWIDNQFGWGLRDWLLGVFHELTNGAIGKENS